MKKNKPLGAGIKKCSICKLLIFMKLTFLLTLISIFSVSATSVFPQNTKLSLNLKDVTLKEALHEIETQTDLSFIYKSDVINPEQRINLHVQDATVEETMSVLLAKTNIHSEILGNSIIVLLPNASKLQQQRITGKITDGASGETLAGVTVQVKGTQVGAISQADGTYSVNLPSGAVALVFSFVGYQTQEIQIAGQSIIDVVMQEEVTTLEEVVITGYSTEKKKDIVGSVSVVNTDEMLSMPSGTIVNQLQGKAAGVTTNTDGAPGKSGRIRIRGFGSFTDSEPLYIIDGIPGNIDNVNPNDVSSVQVLKDAASASVYGARAANGVIIVTTNQGKSGRTSVSIDSYYGIQWANSKEFPELLNAQEWGDLYWKAMEGAGRHVGDANWYHDQYGRGATATIPEYILVNNNGAKIGGTALETYKTSDPTLFASLVNPDNYNLQTHQIVKSGDTHWLDEVYNPAPIQNYQVTASGGTDKSTFLISLNYFNQQSTATEYDFFKRYSLRANSSIGVGDHIRIGENLQVKYDHSREVNQQGTALIFHPLIPVYDIMGNPASSAAPSLVSAGGLAGRNPVTTPWEHRFDKNVGYGIFGNAFLELNILKDIVIKSSYGVDVGFRTLTNFHPSVYVHFDNFQPQPDNLQLGNYTNTSWVWTNTATYSKTLNKHVFKILLGTEAIRTINLGVVDQKFGYAIQNDENFITLSAGTGSQYTSGTKTREALFSMFGRLDYTYADKYIVNATLRRDGSSKFGKNNRYGIFPSFALGWRITGEEFMQNLTWLTDLKLRGSYGVIGNQNGLSTTNAYTTYTGWDEYSYAIQGLNNKTSLPFTVSTIGNPDAKWEKSKSTNVGLDATILQGRIIFIVDVYQRKTDDLLVQNQAPMTGSWATQPFVNVGSVRNRGIDLTATTQGDIIGDLKYEFTATFSRYKNKVLKVLNNPASTLTSGNSRTQAGYPMAYKYGYKLDGFFNSQQEVDDYTVTGSWIPPGVGRWKIKDVDKNGVINDYDRTYLGSPHPDFQMSFNLSLSYKNFDFMTNVFWNKGGVVGASRGSIDFFSQQYNRSKRMLYDSWTPEHMNAQLPMLNINDTWSTKNSTDYGLESATYVRVKTIQLGYTVPKSLIGKLGIDRLRLYVQIQNPFTWDKYSGLDIDAAYAGYSANPTQGALIATRSSDLSFGGGGSGSTPTPIQFIGGLNLSF
jgi:TonB-dependent starch-binding outer membrane protein SusC